MLNNFGTGWKNLFQDKLESLKKVFPEIEIKTVKRHNAMLRIEVNSNDKDIQYIVNCVAFFIERESAKRCENCAKIGRRRMDDPRLPEPKCLCGSCYALELDRILTNQ